MLKAQFNFIQFHSIQFSSVHFLVSYFTISFSTSHLSALFSKRHYDAETNTMLLHLANIIDVSHGLIKLFSDNDIKNIS